MFSFNFLLKAIRRKYILLIFISLADSVIKILFLLSYIMMSQQSLPTKYIYIVYFS